MRRNGNHVLTKARGLASFVAAVLVAALLIPQAQAQTEPDSDVSAYVALFGVTPEEAQRRLDLQAQIGELDAMLGDSEPEAYGGLWIEHKPTHRVIVQFVRDGEALMARYLANPAFERLESIVEVRQVRYSLVDLQVDQSKLAELGAELEFATSINVVENRIDLMPTSKTDRARLGAAVLAETVWIDPHDSAGGPVVNIYGGLNFNSTENLCTTGFGIWENDLAIRAITTAGHCGNTATVNGLDVPLIAEHYYGNDDAQSHRAPGQTVKNWVKDNDGTRSITSRTSRTSQPIGGLVCKYGRSTGYTCGTLGSKNFCAFWIPGGTCTFMEATPGGGPDMVNPGDSGGPVYSGSSAYGLVAAEWGAPWCPCNLIYTAINYVESGLGVRVLTN